MSIWTTKAEGGTHALDRAEVLHALTLLMDREQTFELRSLPSGRSRICHGQDLPAAVEAAWELSDEKGLYFTLNPLTPGLDRPAKDRDVIFRRWLLIDVDGVKSDITVSATESEKVAGYEVAGRILDYLSVDLHWPSPIISDSGNGWHLLYRIDLPGDKLSQQILRSCLLELGKRFDTNEARIDRAVHNASRISKLPGSWARKGPDTAERPHRLSRIVYEPEALEVVTVEQLQALVSQDVNHILKPDEVAWNGSPFAKTIPSTHVDAYCRRSVESECGRLSMTSQGERNTALNRAAFSLGRMATWAEMDSGWAKGSLASTARLIGLEPGEIEKTIASGWSAGAADPKAKPIDPRTNGKPAEIPEGVSPIVWANTIKPKKVVWLVPRRIPANKMTTFAGQTGMGKTFAVCDLAARITQAMEIPFCGGQCFEQGKVLIISAEDDADDTLLPRFLDLGGDPNRLAFLSPEAEDNFSLAALDLLGKSLDAMGADVRMVAIDPPTSYLGSVNDHKNAELRGLLSPLKRWCKARNVALIFVTHVNKAIGQKVDAMARVMGSVAWVAAVRAAHMFVQDPDMPGKRLYVPLKVNNAKPPKAIRYIIEGPTDDQGIIRWLEETDVTADEAVGAVARKSCGVVATEWLAARFREKTEWESADLKRLGIDAGLTGHQIFKSPEVNALPIDKRQRITSNGDRYWVWIARDGWPSPESAESVNVTPY